MTRSYVADILNISMRQIHNWEKGTSDPSGSALLLFLHVVGGDLDQLIHLVLNPDLPALDGQRLAREWLNRKPDFNQPVKPEPFRIFGKGFSRTVEDLQKLVPCNFPGSRKHHTYCGKRFDPQAPTCLVTVDGQSLYTQIGWKETSNRAFEWGYIGRGPSNLATAILTHEFDYSTAIQHEGRFMHDVIAALPREKGGIEWVLESDQVHLWMTLRKIVMREIERV